MPRQLLLSIMNTIQAIKATQPQLVSESCDAGNNRMRELGDGRIGPGLLPKLSKSIQCFLHL